MLRGVAVALAVLFALAHAAPATAEPRPLGLDCSPRSDGRGNSGRSCQGSVTTFDGVRLDANVSLPPSGDGPFPLVVLMHGFGSSHAYSYGLGLDWAARGYAVLNYTARGLWGSCGTGEARVAGGPSCTAGWLHFASVAHEVRDTQHLAGLLADEGIVDGRRIGVLGHSYGGGQALMLAALRDRIVQPDGSAERWRSPAGQPMEIAAAASSAGWSDLAYALVPNGRFLDHALPPAATSPVGVPKQALLAALVDIGARTGHYAPPGADPGADLPGWRDRLDRGEPYDGDGSAEAIVHELAARHSAGGVATPSAPAPSLVAQGLGDDLFPPSQALGHYNRVKAAHPDATVGVLLIEHGHARAEPGKGNPYVARRFHAWMDHFVRGLGPRPVEGFEAFTQTCPNDAPSGGPFEGRTWAELHPGEIGFSSGPARPVSSASAGDPEVARAIGGPDGGDCAVTGPRDATDTATYRLPAVREGYTLMGSPTVIADLEVSGEHPQLVARLWDVLPREQGQMLVSRTVLRPGAGGRITFQLEANGWRFEPGHVPKLELLGRDAPYLRPSNGDFEIGVANLELRLPVAEPPTAEPGTDPIRPPRPLVVPPGAAPAPGAALAGGGAAAAPPRLRIRLDYRLAKRGRGAPKPSCKWARATARLGGSGLASVERVDFLRGGQRVARDHTPPFAMALRPGRGESRKLVARAVLAGGGSAGASARLRRCG